MNIWKYYKTDCKKEIKIEFSFIYCKIFGYIMFNYKWEENVILFVYLWENFLNLKQMHDNLPIFNTETL